VSLGCPIGGHSRFVPDFFFWSPAHPDLLYLETSALTGENVQEMFLKVARTVLNKVDDGTIDPNAMNSGVQLGGGRAGRTDGGVRAPGESNAPQGGCPC
jgi:hypothetical protein